MNEPSGRGKLLGIDTNILIRYILQDDLVQFARASKLIESLSRERSGYITLVTVAELFWVLDRSYKLPRNYFAQTLQDLLISDAISFQDETQVAAALDLFSQSNTADFSDCLIATCSIEGGCDSIMTFDKTAAKVAGMTLLI